jgi:hypothetical protein
MPELWRLLGHNEAAPNDILGPDALQGLVLEGACDDGRVLRRTAKRARPGGRLDHLLRGQWPGAQAHGEEQDRALGEIIPPARRAFGRRINLGGRGWWALPKGCGCYKLKILAVSTAAPLHYRGGLDPKKTLTR